jgi:SAM-dependent methyltransferase
MSLIRYIIHSTQKRGVADTLRYVLDNYLFKLKYPSLNIGGLIQLDKLSIKGDNKKKGVFYFGATSHYFRKIISHIHEMDMHNASFIDFGCGKGKVLALAAEKGIKHIAGVEFARELFDICIKNISLLKKKFPDTEFAVSHEDACNYDIPMGATIFFLNNPFNRDVMQTVIGNIENSLREHKRKIYIIYFNPVDADLFIEKGFNQLSNILSRNNTEAILLVK